MDEPKILVVDENDKPISSSDKPEVWKTGERHRIVWVVVENTNGEILLQKRPNTMDLYPGRWDISVGGHVDEGESWKQAAKRELKEELGVSSDNLKEIGKFYKEIEFEGRKLNRFYKTYKLVTDRREFDYDKHELAAVKWSRVDEARSLVEKKPDQVANGLKEVIGRYYS